MCCCRSIQMFNKTLRYLHPLSDDTLDTTLFGITDIRTLGHNRHKNICTHFTFNISHLLKIISILEFINLRKHLIDFLCSFHSSIGNYFKLHFWPKIPCWFLKLPLFHILFIVTLWKTALFLVILIQVLSAAWCGLTPNFQKIVIKFVSIQLRKNSTNISSMSWHIEVSLQNYYHFD